jgi:hypothetical protein
MASMARPNVETPELARSRPVGSRRVELNGPVIIACCGRKKLSAR